MGKIIFFILFLSFINVKSQIIAISKNENYTIKKNNTNEFVLNVTKNKIVYTYLIKSIRNVPKKENKVYTFCKFKTLPKTKGKMFSPFQGLSFGNGYFLIENNYYKNLGTPIH